MRVSRRSMLATVASVLIASFVAVQTVPELLLFRDRLVESLFEFEHDMELRPIDLATTDGLILRSWYRSPEPGRPVIVYFPGRAGDIAKKPAHLHRLAAEGYGLMLAGYRGYGGNPGRPSERHLYEDARTLLVKLSEHGLAPDGIVLYGYSMGTGVASYLASLSPSRGLILEAPFTSFSAVVHNAARPVPMWLVRTKFDTKSRFGEIRTPILLLAGEKDRITPPSFAEGLAALNTAFASLQIIPNAAHDTLIENGAADAISAFLHGLVAPALPKPSEL